MNLSKYGKKDGNLVQGVIMENVDNVMDEEGIILGLFIVFVLVVMELELVLGVKDEEV